MQQQKAAQSLKGTNSRQAEFWLLLLVFAGTSLVIGVNVNDSTIFKKDVLFIFTCALVCLGLARRAGKTNLQAHFSSLHVVFLLYVLASAMSLTFASNMRLGFSGLAELMCCFVIFAATVELVDTRDASEKALGMIVLTVAVACAAGLLQLFVTSPLGIAQILTTRQMISLFGNAGYFSGFLVLVFPLILSLLLLTPGFHIRRTLLILLTLVLLYLLVRTESRSAWAAAVASSVLFVLMNFKTLRQRLWTLGIVIATATVITIAFPDIVMHRLAGVFDVSPQSSVIRRMFFYKGAWNAFLSSPILGNGIGNFIVFLPKFRFPGYWMFRSEDIVPHAHNEYLEILSETGIAGFLFFLTLIILYLIYAARSLRTLAGRDRTLLIGFMSGIAATLFDNFASMNLRTVPVEVGFWMFMGLSFRYAKPQGLLIDVPLPPLFRNFRYVPYVGLGVFLWIYIPTIPAEYSSERNLLEGEILHQQNSKPGALGRYRQAVAFNPHHALARFSLASALAASNIYTESRNNIRTLLQEYPWYPKAHIIAAITSFELGDTTAALHELSTEMKIEDSPQTYYYAAYFAFRLHHDSTEINMLTTLLSKNTESGIDDFAEKAIDRLSDICVQRSRPDECQRRLHDLRHAFPDNLSLLTTIAECYTKIGMKDEATATARQALALPQTDQQTTLRLQQILAGLNERIP